MSKVTRSGRKIAGGGGKKRYRREKRSKTHQANSLGTYPRVSVGFATWQEAEKERNTSGERGGKAKMARKTETNYPKKGEGNWQSMWPRRKKTRREKKQTLPPAGTEAESKNARKGARDKTKGEASQEQSSKARILVKTNCTKRSGISDG